MRDSLISLNDKLGLVMIGRETLQAKAASSRSQLGANAPARAVRSKPNGQTFERVIVEPVPEEKRNCNELSESKVQEEKRREQKKHCRSE